MSALIAATTKIMRQDFSVTYVERLKAWASNSNDNQRRRLFFALALAALATACSPRSQSVVTEETSEAQRCTPDDPVSLVYPHLDSANSRWFYFDSASRPFGLVNLSPDTVLDGAWGAGYRYDETNIKVFSHIHAWQLSGVAIMPSASAAPLEALRADYSSNFNHDDEVVRPGYHRVELLRHGIIAELTASERVGWHRYQFPSGAPRRLVLPMSGPLGPSSMIDGVIEQTGPRSISGKITNAPTRRRPKPVDVFFHISFNTDIAKVDGWLGDDVLADVETFAGEQDDAGAVVSLVEGSDPVILKVALSYVDADGARMNMLSEAPGWDFDQAVSEAESAWRGMLSRIKVEGGAQQDCVRFYTDLWHALQGRRMISDVDGRYVDMTGAERRIGQLPLDENGKPLHAHYNSDSFWGAQWTIQTLWPLAYPEIASGMAHSLLQYYSDGGMVPRGPSGGNYTFVMTGASSTPFIVSAYMKGLLSVDPEAVFEALRSNHVPAGIMARAGYEHHTQTGGGLDDYISLGYAPYPPRIAAQALHQDGAGQTLEYAYQDWTLARFAEALGREEDVDMFSARAGNWRNLYDPETGYIRPRTVDGSWKSPFDPFAYQQGFVESNAAQATWFAPHDIAGLAEIMGGGETLIQRLDAAFEEASKLGFTSGDSHAVETHPEYRRIPINYGNQPSMQTAFIFHLAGAPHRTQFWSREIIDAVYSEVSPYDGYNGDEDQGLMGSLAVLMKIGLFQMTGGAEANSVYQVNSPIFERVAIDLHSEFYSGNSFIIEAPGVSRENRYIQSATLNNEPLESLQLTHEQITSGGVLRLEMGSEPNLDLR